MRATYILGAPIGASSAHYNLIDLGPEHPSRVGFMEIRCELEADLLRSVEIWPGANHRCVEKLFEVRDYRQLLALANRHDWQAAFVGELGAALTIEEALRLTPPPRATWLRTVLAEHSRLHSHLGFLTVIPAVLAPDKRVADEIHAFREALREQLADLCGNRVHPMLCRLGGLSADANQRWLDAEARLGDTAAELASQLRVLLAGAGVAEGVAVIDQATARTFGVTGPAARAAGSDLDLRRSAPYLAYADLDVARLPVYEHAGDARSRLLAWIDELECTATLLVAAVQGTTATNGPASVKPPKVIRVPVGETYLAHEVPLGRAGWWLVSRGEKVPWRLKLRTASFSNFAALEAVLPGTRVADLPLALASVGYVAGDIAK